ncbi:MAG: NAD(P)H-hydrate dehydratase [Rubrivivax sp.]
MEGRPIHSAQRVLGAERPWRLYSIDSSRRIEAAALRNWPQGALMAMAGRQVARWVLSMAPHAQRIWVAAGPGGNGGDGLFAAAHLAQCGKRVGISLHGATLEQVLQDTPSANQQALKQAWKQALNAGCVPHDAGRVHQPDLVIDALLGLGTNRPLSPSMAEAVQAIRAQACPCLSIDLPTGLHADTGQALGPVIVKARATLSLLTLKPGLFMGEGRDAAGDIWFDRLDHGAWYDDEPPVAHTICRPLSTGIAAARPHASHKGSFGDVVVVGGAPGMSGALRLAAHAALAAGAGRVIAVPLDAASPLLDEVRPECMWMRPDTLLQDYPLEKATVICGCGGGPAVQGLLPALMRRAQRLVLDADALNALAAQPSIALELQARADRGLRTILTPHPLEAARLLQSTAPEVQGARLDAAKRLAAQHRATVVLKGSGTVVATSGEVPCVNLTGGGSLAVGGTGDVLAGWLGGRWAGIQAGTALARGLQDGGADPQSQQTHLAACHAVCTHGRAADRLGSVNAVRALDLVEQMRRELAHLS